MQPNEDEKFEDFLRRFHPRAPQPLHIEGPAIRRLLVFAAWAAATVAMLAVALAIVGRPPAQKHTPAAGKASGVAQLANPQPLTRARANAMLARAPSARAVMDALTFHSQNTPAPKGMRSALEALGEENFKEKTKL